MLRRHTNSLDAELAAAEVEEIFQVGTQEVDDENIMETLLSKMVDLRNADCAVSRGKTYAWMLLRARKTQNSRITYGCRSRFGMIDIHPEVEELRTSGVPVGPYKSVVVTPQASTDASWGYNSIENPQI